MAGTSVHQSSTGRRKSSAPGWSGTLLRWALRIAGCMTRLTDVVTDIADLLRPPLQAFDGAAKDMALAAQQRSHRAAARGALSPVWTDLMELDPDRMRRADGTDELPTAWPAAPKQRVAAVDRALAQLDAKAAQPRGLAAPDRRAVVPRWSLGGPSQRPPRRAPARRCVGCARGAGLRPALRVRREAHAGRLSPADDLAPRQGRATVFGPSRRT
jgi:hypothetical protein